MRFTKWQDTYPILSADGHYWRNLTLARIGILPYFVIATLVVFFWTKRLYGPPAGLLAAAVFTMLPTILAHSAVATTDIAFAAMFCWALYAFTLWLRQPDRSTAAQFGTAAGLALCAKFSTLAFLPSCGAAILVLYAASGRRDWRALLRTVGVAVLCAFLVTWAVYRFSHAPVNQVTTVPDRVAAKLFGESSRLTGLVRGITSRVQLPAPELLDGVRMMREQHRARHDLLPLRTCEEGRRMVVLLLCRAGTEDASCGAVASGIGARQCASLSARPERLGNCGADGGGGDDHDCYGAQRPQQRSALCDADVRVSKHPGRGWIRVAVDAARTSRSVADGRCDPGAWLVISSVRAHPDYLAYFNEFGGKDPSRLLVISDLDWGQDLTRLATYLREHDVKHVSIAYDGFYDPAALGLPDTEIMPWCGGTASGWVAIAVRRVRLHPECFQWLSGAAAHHSSWGRRFRFITFRSKQ